MSEQSAESKLPLTDGERRQVQRLLSDPLLFPIEFRAWLKAFTELEEDPIQAVAIGGEVSWEDAGVDTVADAIRFNTDNQGGWLQVTTNAENPHTMYGGMALVDKIGWMTIQSEPPAGGSAKGGFIDIIGGATEWNGSEYVNKAGAVDISAYVGPESYSGFSGNINLYADREIGLYTGPVTPLAGYGAGDIGLYAARDIGFYSDRDTAIYATRDVYLEAGIQSDGRGGDVRIEGRAGTYAPGDVFCSAQGEAGFYGANVWVAAYPDGVKIDGRDVTIQTGIYFNELLDGKVSVVRKTLEDLPEKLFEIWPDGSLHGKAGQSLVFDL